MLAFNMWHKQSELMTNTETNMKTALAAQNQVTEMQISAWVWCVFCFVASLKEDKNKSRHWHRREVTLTKTDSPEEVKSQIITVHYRWVWQSYPIAFIVLIPFKHTRHDTLTVWESPWDTQTFMYEFSSSNIQPRANDDSFQIELYFWACWRSYSHYVFSSAWFYFPLQWSRRWPSAVHLAV